MAVGTQPACAHVLLMQHDVRADTRERHPHSADLLLDEAGVAPATLTSC